MKPTQVADRNHTVLLSICSSKNNPGCKGPDTIFSQKPLRAAATLAKEWSRDFQPQAQDAETNEGCIKFFLSAE